MNGHEDLLERVSPSERQPYRETVIEMDEAALAAATRELASEKQAAVDQAFDVVAARARGRSAAEVEALLRQELLRRGVEPDGDTALFAQQISAAVDLQV